MVMLRKAEVGWRMCIDFTNLNATAILSFINAHSGYNQVLIAKEDKEKMIFITKEETFCYTVMPFSLQNTGVTFQQLMDKIFKNQVRRNVEANVNDILIHSKEKEDHLANFEITLQNIRTARLH